MTTKTKTTILTGLFFFGMLTGLQAQKLENIEFISKPDPTTFKTVPSGCDTIKAQYPGGEQGLINILSIIPYPRLALERDIQGTVFAKFTIRETGKIYSIHIFKEADEILNEAVLIHLSKMQDWTPAECGEQKISTNLVLPMKFRLTGQQPRNIDNRKKSK